jgi:DNA-binding NarL/FixJ family response regulator
MLDPLFAHIDAAFRRVPALALAVSPSAHRRSNVLDLSTRELEVLEALCRGKTNLDIATVLDISPFTVKNHVQRIFRKIGVTNRTQAAARYAEAMRQQEARAKQPAELVAQTA